jgi:xanthine dehydrogenase iron-sulfur cluster and FAD-binding subunit A
MNIGGETALRIHLRYSRDQILASMEEHIIEYKKHSREGGHYVKRLNVELHFVTLQKRW